MKRLLKSFVVVLALAAFATAITACGEMSKAEYQKKVKAIMDKVEKDGDKVFSSSNPTDKDFKTAEKLINEAADDLDAINPPSEVETLHDHMVEDIRTLAEAMPKFGAAMTSLQKDPAKAEKVMKDLEKDQKKVEAATKRMEETQAAFVKKGYTAFKDKEEK